MARKAKDSNDFILEGLQTVIDRIQDGRLSEQEIRNIVYQWCTKNYQYVADKAAQLDLIPNRLTLYALLYVHHPLIVAPDGALRQHFLQATATIIQCQLEERTVEIPIGILSTIQFTPPVERIEQNSENPFHPQG